MDRFTQADLININLQYAVGLVAVFVTICLLASGINQFLLEPMRRRRHLDQRLKGNKREQEFRTQIFKAALETRKGLLVKWAERVAGWGRIESLQRQLLQADIYLTPNVFLTLVVALGGLGFVVGSVLGNPGLSLALALVLGMLPILFLRWKRHRKTSKIERHMPDAMELLARSLRAGHTLQATLELVSQEIPAPLGKEMRITYEEQRLGLSMNQAFRRMGERVASRDLRYFVTAVLIQSETGGNLAEILENIGLIIRERLKLKGKVRGLTAEGRFSALVLGVLPVLTFLALFVINRKYVMVLFDDPLGIKILTVGIVNIILGAIVMKKMVTIKI
jgi:tight adherence protein B